MSEILQIALGLAALAVTVLALVLIPAVFHLRRQAGQITQAVTDLRAEVGELAVEAHKNLQSLHALSTRLEHEWSMVEDTVARVHGWTARADAVLSEVDTAIAPPVLSLARVVGLARVGLGAFRDAWRCGRHGGGDVQSMEGDSDV